MVLDDCAGNGRDIRRIHDLCAGVAEWESESGYIELDVYVVVFVVLQFALGVYTFLDLV